MTGPPAVCKEVLRLCPDIPFAVRRARTVAEARSNSLVDNARMFALMELGLADESIANWPAM